MDGDEDAEPCCTGGVAERMILPSGHHICIVRDSLLAGGAQRTVNVSAEAGGQTYALGTLSPEAPGAAVPDLVLRDEVVLRHDSKDATVSIWYRFLADEVADAPARLVEPTVVDGVELEPLDDDDYPEPDESDGGGSDDDDEQDAVHDDLLFCFLRPPPQQDDGEDDGAYEPRVEYEPLDEDVSAERYDSDNGEDDEPRKGRDGEAAGESSKRASSLPLVAAPAGSVVPQVQEFLGPARYSVVENTAGFIRVAAAEGCPAVDQEGKELYRYTRFSRSWSGQRGVEACRRTKLHWLRFAVPSAGEMATSLGPLIYPPLFRRQLHELWSSLAAPAINTVPPQATRLRVVVDVGILRREDHTPEREEEAEQDECAVCFDPLESGLAAWPGCRHVFHGACVEKTLAGSEMCPLCRNKLSDQLVR